MLTLYSFGPGANSLKPLLTIYEKQLPPDHPYRIAAAKGLAEVTR